MITTVEEAIEKAVAYGITRSSILKNNIKLVDERWECWGFPGPKDLWFYVDKETGDVVLNLRHSAKQE